MAQPMEACDAPAQASLLSLDDALLCSLLASLDVASLARLRATCRRLAAVGAAALGVLRALDVSPLGRAAGGALRMAAIRCPRLESLTADDVHPLTDADVAGALGAAGASLRVVRLRNLRHLSNDALVALSRAAPTRLEVLDLAGCRRVADGALAALLLLRRGGGGGCAATLRQLDLSDTAVSDAGLRLLAGCPSLRRVSLGYEAAADGVRFLYAGGAGAGTAAAAVAAGVTHAGLVGWLRAAADAHGAAPLRQLALPHRKHVRHEELLPALAATCPYLESLDVRCTRMCGAAVVRAFAAAPGAARARVLLIGTLASSCGDDDLAELAARCTALEVLDLSNHDDVSDAGLAHLAALPALRELTLVRNSRVTSGGAAAMLATAPLRRLRMVRCARAGAAALARLQAQFPSCAVEWE